MQILIKDDDTIRIFNTHLQSFKFKQADYTDLEKIKEQDDETLRASKNIMYVKCGLLLKDAGAFKQGIVREESMDESPYNSLICGDFNDVPNSYTYFHIRGDYWQDAFLKKGFWYRPHLYLLWLLPSGSIIFFLIQILSGQNV